jgi:hypothetical protein
MEVTEIILAKVSRLCQLSSHSRGFLSRIWIFKNIGPSLWISCAYKTPYDDTKMLLKVIFDKIAFVKFKISNTLNETLMKYVQYNQKSIGKSLPAYGY